MYIKALLKDMIGRNLSIAFCEKLTEYCIEQHEPALSLARSTAFTPHGNTWDDVVGRGREDVWKRTLARIGRSDILFLEFGVYKGYSLDFFTKLNRSEGSKFYGFDSFEGLPEGWRGNKAGHFSTSGQLPNIEDSRVELVKGWFKDTLPCRMQEIEEASRGKVLLVHFDADLYSSTLFVLCTLTQRFKDFFFVFDEFSGHEMRALYNFMQAFGAGCEFFYHVNWRGAAAAVSGELRMGAMRERDASHPI